MAASRNMSCRRRHTWSTCSLTDLFIILLLPLQTSLSVSGGQTRSHSQSRDAAVLMVVVNQTGHLLAYSGHPGSTAIAFHPLEEIPLSSSFQFDSPQWPGRCWRWSEGEKRTGKTSLPASVVTVGAFLVFPGSLFWSFTAI